MLKFDAVWSTVTKDERPTILLGNGFSQAWNRDIFNYANLLEKANFGIREESIRKLFERMETSDFESIMKILLSSQLVLESYNADQSLIDKIIADQEILKNSLLTAISISHPNLPSAINHNQYLSVIKFLSKFGKIFTVNYDLLMYWSRNKSIDYLSTWRTDDGFRVGRIWKGFDTDQNIYFLHGGLHIFEESDGVRKHSYNEHYGSIIEQVKYNLFRNKFPLFVSEPTTQKKMQRIDKSPYLSYCLRALQHIGGTIFIYGHSLDENDSHIFKKINLSYAKKIYISIYGDETSDSNKRIKANARTYFEKENRLVEFFDASSVKIW